MRIVIACSLLFPVETPRRNGDQRAVELLGVAGDLPCRNGAHQAGVLLAVAGDLPPLQLKDARGARVVTLISYLPPRRPDHTIPGGWGGRRNGLTWLGSAGALRTSLAPPLRLQSRDRIAASEHDPSTCCFPRPPLQPPRPLLCLRQYEIQRFNGHIFNQVKIDIFIFICICGSG